ncbi:MAG: replicative DNA helicase [Christensenellales bacterium]|jgi:replicative DNA helicase
MAEHAPAQIPQIPPHSAEAERAVLGAALKSQTAFATVSERLTETDFYLPGHAMIYGAMLELHAAGTPVDIVTTVTLLETKGQLAQAGGLAYVTDLPLSVPTVTNLPYYLNLVEEQAIRRRLISAANDIASDSFAGEADLSTLLSTAEKRVFDISMKDMSRGLKRISEDILDVYLGLGAVSSKSGITGLATGFHDLDAKLSGLQKSDLIIVAGRPSMGKTSFAINMAQYAMLHGAAVAIFSLEMSREQLMTRMMCSDARVDLQALRTGALSQQDWDNLSEAMTRLQSTSCYIDDTGGITVSEMRTKLRRLKLELGRLDLVVIDYLQLMSYTGKSENRVQIVAEITRSLKMLARELDVPIVLLSQLSRAPEQRQDHRPMMSDLRESGSIEQDADVIILLYRPAVYDPTAGNEALAIVAKHRNGPTGDIDLIWNGSITSYQNVSDRQ